MANEPVSPLTINELRYLRKAVRFRLGLRQTPPSGDNTSVLRVERRHELDSLADWFVQESR
jgi:hypothetical protein